MNSQKTTLRKYLSIFTVFACFAVLNSCSSAQARTYFDDKAPTVNLSALPCPSGATYDPDIHTISCFNDDESQEDWLVKQHSGVAGVRYELCENPLSDISNGDVLLGEDWFLWWIPVTEATMKSVQKEMGGEIIKVSDYCSEE